MKKGEITPTNAKNVLPIKIPAICLPKIEAGNGSESQQAHAKYCRGSSKPCGKMGETKPKKV